MKILIGTTNPAKVGWYEKILPERNAEFLTLKDLDIDSEPEETGLTPEDNARIKAAFYGRYFDRVICGDSGLYFSELPLEDPRQPGLNIRSPQGVRLDDEEMIRYYSALIHSLGGRVTAHYLNGTAVWNCGRLLSHMERGKPVGAFYMTDVASGKRHPGWPLDSLSVRIQSGKYFTEEENGESPVKSEEAIACDRRLAAFLKGAFGLEEEE